MITLREYQKECVDLIDSKQSGRYLIQMATGLGKTATFTHINRKGRVLVLAHREELITQPIKYYDCPVGIEMASNTSKDEDVVIASVQSLAHRLQKFKKDEFDTIIIDEAHHAAATTYMRILDYFEPRLVLGFTATPNRGDKQRLDHIFQEIIFQRDLRWAIENGYLTDIYCLRVNVGYDISKVARRMGDFAVGELEEAMNQEAVNNAIKEAYTKYAKGQTLIFATSVKHAQAIAEKIDGAVAVTADTKNRAELIKKFTNREIPVLVNCMIFTEGTDMPLVETVMIARPTQSDSLYTQMVGRGLRLYPGKEKLTLIDLVGVTGKASLCTAPTLLGIDLDTVPSSKQDEIQGDLFDLPDIVVEKSDCVESWIRNVEFVDLWAKAQKYNTFGVNYFKLPSGDLKIQTKTFKYIIPAQDELGKTRFMGETVDMQTALDMMYKYLCENYPDERAIWDVNIAKKWGHKPATPKQLDYIYKRTKCRYENLTKLQASQILNRLCY